MTRKVAIVGAGPCGILLAHYLLRRDTPYQVDVYERRNDPRSMDFSNARTFPITINERGLGALKQIPGLAEAVKTISVEIWGTIFHPKKGKPRITTRRKPFIALDRTNLVIALLKNLPQTHSLHLHFNHHCTAINPETKTACIQPPNGEPFTIDYDLLVGADGSRSIVREQFLNADSFECQQNYVPRDYKSLYLANADQQSVLDVQSGKIHSWRSEDGTILLLVPQPGRMLNGLIHFPHDNRSVPDLSTSDAALQFFKERFPELAQIISASEVEEFLKRPLSRVLTIRCNRYHFGDSVLILGDAAHAVSPALGQGCNASLEDVFVFNQILDACLDDLPSAIEQFTQGRNTDALALAELSDYAFPSSSRLFIEFILRDRVARFLHQRFPKQFVPPLSEMLFETSIPYSQILQTYRGWIDKVKRDSQVA
jgi:kynurenine 3-monooxygenase